MKTEDHAWRSLQSHAAAQLRPDFAARALRAARGPEAATWQQLSAHAAEQIRPGFAARVIRAARALPQAVPSFRHQLAFSAGVAAACVLAVVLVHGRSTRLATERNLADWQRFAAEVQDLDQNL
ncbi:MAG: hypothetical protein EXS32_08475 [Opitutus sp.]|nr:hypothetical protein [Opitutus sp.]